ncbi:hypothetical protein CVT24_009505 [Panaeolus cyanescens]|uniref:Uncharacterized protein n=1 Tax=Panaeolus cyanescens TaxID=181874 RepID=A0A409VCM7_9AGAR|nr:hypothetical protein CVT24_009505 [Panaeolus cyanescens]
MQFVTNLAAIVLALIALVVNHASAQCTPTGPGVCNVGFVGHIGLPLSSPMKWDRMNIYDRYCNTIGGRDYPTQGMAVPSQLPYTVVITRLQSGGDYNRIGFCYAGQCFDGGFWGNIIVGWFKQSGVYVDKEQDED